MARHLRDLEYCQNHEFITSIHSSKVGGGGGGGVPFIQSLVQYYSSNVYSLHYLPCYIVSQNAMTMCVCACACVCVGVCVCVCVCVCVFLFSSGRVFSGSMSFVERTVSIRLRFS